MDIVPIVDERHTESDLKFHLQRLMHEIRQRDLHPRWLLKQRRDKSQQLRSGERIIHIRNTQWILSKVAFGSTIQDTIYLDFVSALESGEFQKLRRCPRCSAFFFKTENNQRYCKTSCQQELDSENARNRTNRSRIKQKQKAKTNGLPVLAYVLTARSAKPLTVVCENPIFKKLREKLDGDWEIFQELCDNNLSCEQTWNRMPKRVQVALAEMRVTTAGLLKVNTP
jgi:hypothetical protein